VHVPELVAPKQELDGEIAGQRLATAQCTQRRSASEAAIDEHAPRSRRRLQDRRTSGEYPAQQEPSVERLVPAREFDAGTDDERQVELEPGDVERQRRDGEQAVVLAATRNRLHR